MPAPVQLRLLGQDVDATSQAFPGDEEPAEVERGLRAYAGRFPRTAAKTGLGSHPAAGDEALGEAVKRAVIVRISPPEAALRQARAATRVTGRGVPATVRRPPGAYFLLALTLSWSYWIPVAVAGGRPSHFPGLLGPMLAAILVTAVGQGRAGLRDPGARMARWRLPLRWYAATVPLTAGLVALGGLWAALLLVRALWQGQDSNLCR